MHGLQPSSKGARIRFSGKNRTVIDGPLPRPRMVAGYWIIQVKSKEEAIEWDEALPIPPGGLRNRDQAGLEIEDSPGPTPSIIIAQSRLRWTSRRASRGRRVERCDTRVRAALKSARGAPGLPATWVIVIRCRDGHEPSNHQAVFRSSRPGFIASLAR